VKFKIPSRNITFPNYLVTDKIKIEDDSMKPTYSYSISASKISVLDGFIDIDTTYFQSKK